MSDRFRLGAADFFFAACVVAFTESGAGGQDRPPNAFLESVRFVEQKGSKPLWKNHSYGGGNFKALYGPGGFCTINNVSFLAPKYHYTFSTNCRLKTGDLVGILGGVFRAECGSDFAVLDRVPENDLPNGVKAPEWDSITLPRTGGAGFNLTLLKVSEIGDKKDATALLRVELSFREEQRKQGNINLSAKVKAGDILLLRDKGHLVRAIVPPDEKSRVIGWVELSPEPIPEADLIRDKKVIVRPMQEKKAEQPAK
jgi:hypothetical protein